MTMTMTMNGEKFVVLPWEAYSRMVQRLEGEAPEYPEVDAKGGRPARATLRVSMARQLIRRRTAAGWTQEQLARRAKVRVETISRLESGKHAPHHAGEVGGRVQQGRCVRRREFRGPSRRFRGAEQIGGDASGSGTFATPFLQHQNLVEHNRLPVAAVDVCADCTAWASLRPCQDELATDEHRLGKTGNQNSRKGRKPVFHRPPICFSAFRTFSAFSDYSYLCLSVANCPAVLRQGRRLSARRR
ncbi:MAG: helix-turn-helix transcriptional regulator [Phycisphaeraceae bacterium]